MGLESNFSTFYGKLGKWKTQFSGKKHDSHDIFIFSNCFWKFWKKTEKLTTSGDLRRPPATSGKRKFKKVNFPKNLFFLRLRRPPATSGHPFFLKFWKKPPPATSGDLRRPPGSENSRKLNEKLEFPKNLVFCVSGDLRRPPETSGDPFFLKTWTSDPFFLKTWKKTPPATSGKRKIQKTSFSIFPIFHKKLKSCLPNPKGAPTRARCHLNGGRWN